MKNSFYFLSVITVFMSIILLNCTGGSSSPDQANNTNQTNDNLSSGSATGGERNPVCASGDTTGEVEKPQFMMNLSGQTGWFASPLIVDLDDDGRDDFVPVYDPTIWETHRFWRIGFGFEF